MRIFRNSHARGPVARRAAAMLRAGLVAFALVPAMAATAHAGTLTLQNTFDFSSGHYGDPQVTNELYEALAVKYEFGDTLIKLTVPYLYVDGPANVVPDFGAVQGGADSTARLARDGLGDIVVSVDQSFSVPSLPNTDLDVIAKVKFGTASYARGLGTGENDYYLQLEWTQHLGHGVSTTVDFGRRFVESPAETGLHDVWYGSVGADWKMDSKFTLSTYLDLRQATSLYSGDKVEATLQVSDRFSPGWKLIAYATKGFARASPDLCGGLILERSFSF